MKVLPPVVRRWLVAVRDTLDGALHGRRRARARARISSLAPSSVLFVCLGNVCRSPYGERVWRTRAPGGAAVDSVGFIGPGRPPPDAALAAAGDRGIDHADHTSKLAEPGHLASAGVVFVFDRFNLADVRATGAVPEERILWLGDFDPRWTGKRAIADPWGKGPSDFEVTFARIERCVSDALDALGAGHGG